MGPEHLLVASVLLCITVNDVHGYVLRDRSWDEDNTLADALQVISRERRRLADEQYSRGTQPRPFYWDEPRSEMQSLPDDDDEEAEEAERRFLSRLFTSSDSNDDFVPTMFDGPDNKETESDNSVSESDQQEKKKRSEVKRAELEGIFQPVGKRSSTNGNNEVSGTNINDKLNDVEVKALLDTIESGGAEDSTGNNNNKGQKIEEVSEVELEDILGPSEAEQIQEIEEEDPQEVVDEEPDWPEGINKEWLVNQFMEGQPGPVSTVKHKRSDDTITEPEPMEITSEPESESVDISILKQYLALEDDENSNLALALNQATKAQISSKPGQYIPEEIGYLQQAIKDEEEIQNLRTILEGGDPTEQDEVQSSDILPMMNDMDEETVEEKRTPDTAESDDDMVQQMLADKLKQYIIKVAQSGYDSNVPVTPEEDENELYGDNQWNNAPVAYQEEGLTDGGYELNPFLRELIQKYRNGRLDKRNSIQQIEAEDMCPAILETTNNCAAARELGLALDDEAVDLCNRHQTCYSCGSSHDFTADDCDTGYLQEADNLCAGSEDCKDEAAALYVIMLQEHGFVREEDAHYTCNSKCTFDYIIGAGAK